MLWFVVSPQYSYTEVLLDDGTGPSYPTCDYAEVEAGTRREAVSLAVKQWLSERGDSWPARQKSDGLCPFTGVRAESENEAKQRARADAPSPPDPRFDFCDACTPLAKRVRREQPWCAVSGCPNLTEQADHIVPLRTLLDGGGDPYDRSNIEGLCRPCHGRKIERIAAALERGLMDGLIFIVDLNDLRDGGLTSIAMDFTLNHQPFVTGPEPQPQVGDVVRIHSDEDNTLYYATVVERCSDRDMVVAIDWESCTLRLPPT